MVHHGSVNDVIWYSRFTVLVGVLVLVVQAAAGRAQGFVTLLAVLLLCVGFIVFVSSLAVQGLMTAGSGSVSEAPPEAVERPTTPAEEGTPETTAADDPAE